MTRSFILACLAILVLAAPAFAESVAEIAKQYGVTVQELEGSACPGDTGPKCWKVQTPGGGEPVTVAAKGDLRKALEEQGLKPQPNPAAAGDDALAKCVKEWRMGERGDGRANCSDAYLSDIMRAHNRACYSLITASRDKAATECKKSAAPTIAMGLDDPDPKKWNEANCKARFEDAKQPVPEGHPCKAIVAAPKEACDKAMDPKNEGTKDKDVAAQRDSCLARRDQDMGIDREKLKTPEQCQKAMQAQEESKDPEAKKVSGRLSDICGSVVADMLKNIKDNKAEYPAGVLAWFQSDCAKHPEHQAVCIATGFQKKIPEKAAPSYSSEADRQALQTACKGVDGKAGDPAACTRFERLTQIEQLNGRCSAGETAACEKVSRLVTQEEIEKRPQVKRAMAYGATVDQAARYDSYIQRHFKKPEQQDLMERLMRANPETMGKLMDENTQCEKKGGGAAAACDKKFYTNYMALADGHPVSDTGKRYLANMCAMPENKEVGACKDKKAYAIAPRKATAPPSPISGYRRAPAAQPRADSDPISSIITSLMRPFGNSNPRGYVCRLKGTDIACSSAGQQGCECREIR